MDFSSAFRELRQGKLITRRTWTKKYLYMVPSSAFTPTRSPLSDICPKDKYVWHDAHIDMITDGGKIITQWAIEHGDLFADDWESFSLTEYKEVEGEGKRP